MWWKRLSIANKRKAKQFRGIIQWGMGERESLIQDEKGKWMCVSSMQNLMKKWTKKKKEQKNPTNSMTSFKGFGRARIN